MNKKITFYHQENFRLQMEDMIRAIEGKKPIHLQEIEKNEILIRKAGSGYSENAFMWLAAQVA